MNRRMKRDSFGIAVIKIIMLMPMCASIAWVSNTYGTFPGIVAFVFAVIVGALLTEEVDSMTGEYIT